MLALPETYYAYTRVHNFILGYYLDRSICFNTQKTHQFSDIWLVSLHTPEPAPLTLSLVRSVVFFSFQLASLHANVGYGVTVLSRRRIIQGRATGEAFWEQYFLWEGGGLNFELLTVQDILHAQKTLQHAEGREKAEKAFLILFCRLILLPFVSAITTYSLFLKACSAKCSLDRVRLKIESSMPIWVL